MSELVANMFARDHVERGRKMSALRYFVQSASGEVRVFSFARKYLGKFQVNFPPRWKFLSTVSSYHGPFIFNIELPGNRGL